MIILEIYLKFHKIVYVDIIIQGNNFDNSNCHLNERSYKDCLKDIEENKSEIIKENKYLINLKYWAKENNKLYNIQE